MNTLTIPTVSTLGDLKPVFDDLPDVYPKGRTCSQTGCSTFLCQYNPGPECFLHTPRKMFFVEDERDPNEDDPETAHPGTWEAA